MPSRKTQQTNKLKSQDKIEIQTNLVDKGLGFATTTYPHLGAQGIKLSSLFHTIVLHITTLKLHIDFLSILSFYAFWIATIECYNKYHDFVEENMFIIINKNMH